MMELLKLALAFTVAAVFGSLTAGAFIIIGLTVRWLLGLPL